jgi:hypothetical protein
MSLAVIGSGFGRTGTASLKRALELLGLGPCHHMEEVFAHPEQVAHWQAIAAGQAVPMATLFAGYRAQVDWPGAHVWRELAAEYPGAKVVHSVRPEESWWRSFSGTIGALLGNYAQAPLPPHMRAMMDAMAELVVARTLGGSTTDREAALAAYRRRTEQVRAAIPAERLLVFDVSEGWAPLCRFLGVTVPAEPFPHLNSTEDFWKAVRGGAPPH